MPSFRFALQHMDFSERDRIIAAARQAEDLGYDEIYSYDHIGTVDPFVPLVIAAEATSRLRVGPLVLNNEFHHPALLARTAATVDRLTGGRLVLGLGTGYMQSEHDAIDVPLRPPRERVDRFDESLTALRSLLGSGAARVDGRFHRLALDRLGVAPTQARVPFLIGGFGRRVVTIGARHADIFQFTGLTHRPDGSPEPGGFAIEDVERRVAWLEKAAGDRGADIERSVLIQLLAIGEGAPKAIDEAAGRFNVDRALLEESPFVLCGSVEQVVDKLERLRQRLGVSHVVIRDAAMFAPVVERLAGR